MSDLLGQALAHAPHVEPLSVLIRLLIAFTFAFAVAYLYRRMRRGGAGDMVFPSTLVLLCILIAMVTQVIGDSVARAFSLVGALSIVRFRTVVRDTRDTAYVILVVALGMAIGASSVWVASLGFGVIVLAELLFWIRERFQPETGAEYHLKARSALGEDLTGCVSAALEGQLLRMTLVSIGTSKQGDALEVLYRIQLKSEVSVESLMQKLSTESRLLAVQLSRTDAD